MHETHIHVYIYGTAKWLKLILARMKTPPQKSTR